VEEGGGEQDEHGDHRAEGEDPHHHADCGGEGAAHDLRQKTQEEDGRGDQDHARDVGAPAALNSRSGPWALYGPPPPMPVPVPPPVEADRKPVLASGSGFGGEGD
jgi:hypothetical protein